MDTKKEEEYAQKISLALSHVFNPDAPFFIDPKELKEGNNLTHFAHALSNMVPTKFLNDLTGSTKSLLETNHIANIFCFQYGEGVTREEKVSEEETSPKENKVTPVEEEVSAK
jgi:hypothetical protein